VTLLILRPQWQGPISGTAKARVVKFCTQTIISYVKDDKQPLKRACSRDPFVKFCVNHIFWIGYGEARHFKFRLFIDTQEY